MHPANHARFLAASLALAALLVPPVLAGGYQATELDTLAADPDLQNPWGISASPGGPFWVSDNGTGKSTLYSVDPVTNATTKAGLVVSIPGDGSVTGQVYNPTTAFNGNSFLFTSEDGTISGWRGTLGSTAETLVAGSSANVYKGAALATVSGNTYLYASNFRTGAIDVLKGDAAAPSLTGSFTDPNMAAGFAPFNVQDLNGDLFVTYAKQDPNKHDDVAGPGNGFVDEFDTSGNYLSRIGTQGTLDSPWGLAIAPSSLGSFAGDLLVGNFGDGTISAFSLSGTPTFVGQLPGAGGSPLSIDGLWALTVGNNGKAGSSDKLYFTAGPDGESGGAFGIITPGPAAVPEASTTVSFGLLLALGLGGMMVAAKCRKAPASQS